MDETNGTAAEGCRAEESERRGRPAAGTDPAKRRQILDGADRVFSAKGFDAASMNDIAHAAGVSKGTLYVYFATKEDLFSALIEVKRRERTGEVFGLIGDDPDVPATLTRFGAAFARFLTSDWTLRAQRVVLGVTERMPEIGRGFYAEGPGRCRPILADYLNRMTARGLLRVEDADLAAAQFVDLCQTNLVRPRLYRAVDTPPTDAEIAQVVGSAVAMFLAAYGCPAGAPKG
jgi:TetR/AcrR family transcriptional regulator of autoinduction and epiphytic fitness